MTPISPVIYGPEERRSRGAEERWSDGAEEQRSRATMERSSGIDIVAEIHIAKKVKAPKCLWLSTAKYVLYDSN